MSLRTGNCNDAERPPVLNDPTALRFVSMSHCFTTQRISLGHLETSPCVSQPPNHDIGLPAPGKTVTCDLWLDSAACMTTHCVLIRLADAYLEIWLKECRQLY